MPTKPDGERIAVLEQQVKGLGERMDSLKHEFEIAHEHGIELTDRVLKRIDEGFAQLTPQVPAAPPPPPAAPALQQPLFGQFPLTAREVMWIIATITGTGLGGGVLFGTQRSDTPSHNPPAISAPAPPKEGP